MKIKLCFDLFCSLVDELSKSYFVSDVRPFRRLVLSEREVESYCAMCGKLVFGNDFKYFLGFGSDVKVRVNSGPGSH